MDEQEEPSQNNPVFDPTLPGRFRTLGTPHPILALRRRVESALLEMGFCVEEGEEIENLYDHHRALNTTREQPEGEKGEPFRIDDERILSTRAFPNLIRILQNKKPPLRFACSAKVHRRVVPAPDRIPVGFDFAGMLIDYDITFAHLKGTVEAFLKVFFREKRNIRFRPRALPFAEPAVAVDVSCPECRDRKGSCPFCGNSGWIPMMNAGMVDPQIFKQLSIDPESFSGFVFGMSIDHAARIVHRAHSLSSLFENDAAFRRGDFRL